MTQSWQDPDTLLALSRRARDENGGHDGDPFVPGEINLSRPFIHEEFTQLSHTTAYEELSPAQRLRYNQLSGMSSNELFMMFESGFTNRVIQRLLHHRVLKRDPVLRECLVIMLEEEKTHTRMFAALNRQCMPKVYARENFHFTRAGPLDSIALWVLVHIPHHLLLVLWLVMIMEEFSNYISRRMMQKSETVSLGTLETNFVELHQRHLRDESRHVQIDANIIDRLTAMAGQLKRRSNARVLRYLMTQILTPRRAGIAVIEHLVSEFPQLQEHKSLLAKALRSLKSEPGFGNALRCEGEMKLTHLFMESFPEYRFIERYAR